MTTYTWAGGAANWSSNVFWTVNGISNGSVPGSADSVVFNVPGSNAVTTTSVTRSVQVFTVTDPTVNLTLSGYSYGAVAGLYNSGTIQLATSSSLLVGSGGIGVMPSGTLANNGVIAVSSGATLDVETLGESLAGLQNNGGTIVLGGTLADQGSIVSSIGTGVLDLGSVTGGTVVGNGAVGLGPISGAVGHITGVTLIGDFNVQGFEFFDAATVFQPGAGKTVSNLQINGIMDDTSTGVRDKVVIGNASSASSANVTLAGTLGGASTIVGGIAAFGFNDPESVNVATNLGTIEATLRMNVTVPSNLGFIGAVRNGAMQIAGGMDNEGTIAAVGGSVVAVGSLTGAGTVALSAGGIVELQKSYGGQTFEFLDATDLLKLDFPAGSVPSPLIGFVPGDTIELVGNPATTLTTSGSTLIASNGPVTLASFALPSIPAGVHFNLSTDANNDTFITETACFLEGTRIYTAHGEVAVENLRVGDPVLALHAGGELPVIWMGYRTLRSDQHRNPRAVWPVRVAAGAIGNGVPTRDLWLSPEHAVLVEGVLVPIRLLINGATITQHPRKVVTYWHVELPSHDLVLSEGMPSESYLDTGNRSDFANGGPVVAVHPEFASAVWTERACLPQLRHGPRLAAIHAALVRRAVGLGYFYTAEMAAASAA